MKSLQTLKTGLGEFESVLQYKFIKRENIISALTHSSYANEKKNEGLICNERLEFLGDSILNIIISEYIFRNYSNLPEGDMTKTRANIVCETTLSRCANNINIGKYLLLGKGEENTGGRTRVSILSDAFEAIICAIYLDGGIEEARGFVLRQMEDIIKDAVNGNLFLDYKTQLQEIVQKQNDKKIIYEIVGEKGPDHNKLFISQIRIDEEIMGTGMGKTKKEAEQNAAKTALESF